MSTQISASKNQVIRFKNVPVVTTAQLAGFYGVDVNNIQQNFKRNISRFIEGKHYFKLTGQDLKDVAADFKSVANFNKVRQLIVWTERGAARHAKMLDTDHAWDVFERLEDSYFKPVQTAPVVQQKTPYRPTGNDLYLPKAESRRSLFCRKPKGRYFNRASGRSVHHDPSGTVGCGEERL